MIEGKEKENIIGINNIYKKLIALLYNYLNFLSIKRDDYRENYLSYKYEISPVKDKKFNLQNDEDIIKCNERWMKNLEIDLRYLNGFCEKLNEYFDYCAKNYFITNNNEKEVYLYNERNKIKLLKICQNKDINIRNDFLFLFFNNILILKEDSILRDSVKSERKSDLYLFRNKFKMPKLPNDLSRKININDIIKEYIKINFKESPNIEVDVIYPIKNKIYGYNNRMPQNNINPFPIQINVKIFPFNIQISTYLNKELGYGNYKYILSLRDEYKKKKKYDSILLTKIKTLINERINCILKLIYEDKRKKNLSINNNNAIYFDEENLKEFMKKFIFYIYDYNKIAQMKCALCDNIAKYSYAEKCFLPPFYKLYREDKEQDLPPNYRTLNEQKLFFHEDCFRKMANSSL